MHLIIQVKAHAAEDQVLEEGALVGQCVVGIEGALQALHANDKRKHEDRREQGRDSVLVGGIKIGAVLEIVGQVLAQNGAQGKADVGAHGHDGCLGSELLAHGLHVEVPESRRIGHTICDGEQARGREGLGHDAIDDQVENDAHHGLAGLDNVREA